MLCNYNWCFTNLNCGKNSDEGGFVLVSTMVILLLMLVVGVASMTTSSFDINIAGTEKDYRQNFYRSEGAVRRAAQDIENTAKANLENRALFVGLNTESDLLANGDTVNPDGNMSDIEMMISPDWTSPLLSVAAWALPDPLSPAAPRYMIVDRGIAAGSSQRMGGGSSRVHSYDIYGNSNTNNGRVFVNIGYKKRF